MRQIYFLAVLLISVIFVSGCSSPSTDVKPNEPNNDITDQPKTETKTEEHGNKPQIEISDLEKQLTDKPWRPSTSFGTTGSRSRLVLKKGLFGNTWEYGSKTSFSNGNWELKILQEKDLQDLSNYGYDTSGFANQKVVFHSWHDKENLIDAESVIYLDKGEPWKLAPPTGEFIKDYKAESNELI